MRRRTAKPPFCRGPSIGSDALILVSQSRENIVRADALIKADSMQGWSLTLAGFAHGPGI
jgi:hypothetical protein